MTTNVADIVEHADDPVFGRITAIFAKKRDEYAIYRTNGRILVQYADDAILESAQRAAIAPLGPLRSDINALIDGWRASRRARLANKVAGLDRRTADALVIALEGDSKGAVLELNKVRNAVIDDRTSFARFIYLIVALLVALLVGLVVAAMSAGPVARGEGVADLLTAILGGLGGSFFSIATGLSKRTILPTAVGSDNILDAMLRMLIGVISAAILVCLMRSGFGVTFKLVAQVVPASDPAAKTIRAIATDADTVRWMQLVTIGFLAGFSERLVPDLLAKAGQAVQAAPLPNDEPIAAAPSPTPPDLKAAKAEAATAADAASDQAGDCCSDTALTDDEATPDAALPAATGGVR